MRAMENFRRSALNLGERYLKTDLQYLAREGSWLSVGQAYALLSGLALSIIFAKILPREVYGNYKYVLSIGGMLAGLGLTGLTSAVIQAVAKGYTGTLESAKNTYLKWGLIILGLSAIGSIYYLLQNNYFLAISLFIAGVSIPVSGAYNLYGSYLYGLKSFRPATIFWIIGQTLSITLLIGAGYFISNAISLVLAYYLSQIIIAVGFFKYTLRKHEVSGPSDASLLSYGKHISIMNLLGTLANQLDKVLVFHYLGAAQLALYTFAFAIPEQIKGTYKNLFQIALPKYADQDPNKIRNSILDKIKRLTLITALLVVGYCLTAPLIYRLLFPAYQDAVFYSQIYMLGMIAIPGISLFGTYFQVRKDTKTLYKLSVISNLSTIVLTFVLISRFGLLGAVIENGISWFLILAIYIYYFHKDKPTNLGVGSPS